MTASTTMFGLLPLLLARGIGSEVQRPLAVVVVFGLGLSLIHISDPTSLLSTSYAVFCLKKTTTATLLPFIPPPIL